MKIKINIIKTLDDENKFINLLINNNLDKNKVKFCIDFEFNGKNIGLMQLYITKLNLVYLLNPDFFTQINKNILIEKIFLSNNKKILHGSESNDIPYIFNKLLNREPDKIQLFLNNYYDTRFICSLLSFPKCNLYQALINSDILNQEKIDYLKTVEHKLGKIWKINWNPKTLNSNEKIYAYSDVLYLSKLFRQQKRMCKKNNLSISRLSYALRIVLLYRQNLLEHFKIKKIDNYESYFGKILDIDYLRKLRLILSNY
jgi:ribonuclease D